MGVQIYDTGVIHRRSFEWLRISVEGISLIKSFLFECRKYVSSKNIVIARHFGSMNHFKLEMCVVTWYNKSEVLCNTFLS
jgi:hypothetical protein